jgi:hypothetical protein
MNLREALAWLWAAEVAHKGQLRMEMAMRLERFPKRKSVVCGNLCSEEAFSANSWEPDVN